MALNAVHANYRTLIDVALMVGLQGSARNTAQRYTSLYDKGPSVYK